MEQKSLGENPGDAPKQPEVIQPPPVTGTQQTGQQKVCHNCGNLNRVASLFCFKCGFKLPEYVNQDKKICIGCQAPNSASSQYCYKCGLKLPDTPGNVSLLRYGGFWIRLLASIIDNLIISTFTSIISTPFLLHFVGQLSDDSYFNSLDDHTIKTSVLIFYLILIFGTIIIQVAYETIAVGKWGKTIGKAALGLKVVKPDSSRVSYWRALGRSLARQLNQFTFGLTFLMVAFTQKKRGLHDYIADTVVIKTN
jgi:uncharacterized RDD family membrane protein YckC/ribosomal protein L40E